MIPDFSRTEAMIRDEFLTMLGFWQLPSVLYKPRVFPDGNVWCCLYGENLQDGVCAFGDTPQKAVENFDYFAWYGKPVPVAKEAP